MPANEGAPADMRGFWPAGGKTFVAIAGEAGQSASPAPLRETGPGSGRDRATRLPAGQCRRLPGQHRIFYSPDPGSMVECFRRAVSRPVSITPRWTRCGPLDRRRTVGAAAGGAASTAPPDLLLESPPQRCRPAVGCGKSPRFSPFCWLAREVGGDFWKFLSRRSDVLLLFRLLCGPQLAAEGA